MADLRRLEYFLAVARERNFTRAAERLRIAQPALSRQVRLLEQQLGVELLHRTTHEFELTEAGRFLLERGPALLHEADELLYWVEECLVQELKIVPGWLTSRLVQLFNRADPRLNRELGRERRPAQVMEVLYQAQGILMEQSIRSRQPAEIIQLFPR